MIWKAVIKCPHCCLICTVLEGAMKPAGAKKKKKRRQWSYLVLNTVYYKSDARVLGTTIIG